MKLVIAFLLGFLVHCKAIEIKTKKNQASCLSNALPRNLLQTTKHHHLTKRARRKTLINLFLNKTGNKEQPHSNTSLISTHSHRKLNQDLPTLPPADQIPIVINSPAVKLPEIKNPYELQNKLVIAPTIIYPKKKKRIIVHHSINPKAYYHNMFYNMNPIYYQLGKNNPYLKDSWNNNSLKNYIATHGIKDQMKIVKKYVPNPPSSFGDLGSIGSSISNKMNVFI